MTDWRVLNASDYGVPQLRPRWILVALERSLEVGFPWPSPAGRSETVGEVLSPLMGSLGWRGVVPWSQRASTIAPTIVGGSKKHGGPVLGPTRAMKQWRAPGVDGIGIADEPPDKSFPD